MVFVLNILWYQNTSYEIPIFACQQDDILFRNLECGRTGLLHEGLSGITFVIQINACTCIQANEYCMHMNIGLWCNVAQNHIVTTP